MEMDPKQLGLMVRQILSEQLRVGTGTDFHSLWEGYPLVLAGVTIPHDRGFHVKRSDGDPVSHAVVDALLAALNAGDIADWFNDQDGVRNARSLDYLGELRNKILVPRNVSVVQVQVTILAEQPKLKPFFSQMQRGIAGQLGINSQSVNIQGKTFEGKGVIGQQQGIETRAFVALLEAT